MYIRFFFICFRTKEGRTVCFRIPTIIFEPFHWHDPHLRNLVSPKKPGPFPWVFDELLEEGVLQDLTVLATMDRLTAELSPAYKKNLAATIKAEMKKIPLPAGVTLQELKPGQ